MLDQVRQHLTAARDAVSQLKDQLDKLVSSTGEGATTPTQGSWTNDPNRPYDPNTQDKPDPVYDLLHPDTRTPEQKATDEQAKADRTRTRAARNTDLDAGPNAGPNAKTTKGINDEIPASSYQTGA